MRRLVLILLGATCFAGAAGVLKLADRQRLVMFKHTELQENLPPELVVTSALLGGFRGLLVDILWLRATTLKQQKRFFETVQLYDWIGKLQPRFDAVWAYGSWDMAFNIAVELPPGMDRWRWVNSGIAFARDLGLRYNPKSPAICHSVSWIYFFKIGGFMDDSHKLYKEQLFREMRDILGECTREDIDALKEVELQPAPWDAPPVRELRRELEKQGVPWEDILPVLIAPENSRPKHLAPLLENFARNHPGDWEKLRQAVRAYLLRERHRLDPERMFRLIERFGPLDFRTPYALALYWAELSVEYSGMGSEIARVNFERQIYHALQEIVRSGRYRILPDETFVMEPDYRFADIMDQIMLDMLERHDKSIPDNGARSAHTYFMESMVFNMFLLGRKNESQRWFQKYIRRYRTDLQITDLDDYIKENLTAWLIRDIDPKRAIQSIKGILTQAYMQSALNDPHQSTLLFNTARFVHKACVDRLAHVKTDRMSIPEMAGLQKQVLEDIFEKRAGWPDYLIEKLRGQLQEHKDISTETGP